MSTNLNMASVNRIKELVAKQDYRSALTEVESIAIDKSLNPQFMRLCGEVYAENKKFDKARKVLISAHIMAPRSSEVLSELIKLYLRMGYFTKAKQYYAIFKACTPENSLESKTVLYNIKKAMQASDEELIEILQGICEQEYIDSWAFELALLYRKAGMKERSIQECERIMKSFSSSSIYVKWAKPLKMGSINVDKAFNSYPKVEVPESSGTIYQAVQDENRQMRKDYMELFGHTEGDMDAAIDDDAVIVEETDEDDAISVAAHITDTVKSTVSNAFTKVKDTINKPLDEEVDVEIVEIADDLEEDDIDEMHDGDRVQNPQDGNPWLIEEDTVAARQQEIEEATGDIQDIQSVLERIARKTSIQEAENEDARQEELEEQKSAEEMAAAVLAAQLAQKEIKDYQTEEVKRKSEAAKAEKQSRTEQPAEEEEEEFDLQAMLKKAAEEEERSQILRDAEKKKEEPAKEPVQDNIELVDLGTELEEQEESEEAVVVEAIVVETEEILPEPAKPADILASEEVIEVETSGMEIVPVKVVVEAMPEDEPAEVQVASEPVQAEEQPASEPVQAEAQPEEKPAEAQAVSEPVQAEVQPEEKPAEAQAVSTPAQAEVQPEAQPAEVQVASTPVQPEAQPAEAQVASTPVQPEAQPAEAQAASTPVQPAEKPAEAQAVSEPVQAEVQPEAQPAETQVASTPVQPEAQPAEAQVASTPVQPEAQPAEAQAASTPVQPAEAQAVSDPVQAEVQPEAQPAEAQVASTPAQAEAQPAEAQAVSTPAQAEAQPAEAQVASTPVQAEAQPAEAQVASTPAQAEAQPAEAQVASTPVQPEAQPAEAQVASTPVQPASTSAEAKPEESTNTSVQAEVKTQQQPVNATAPTEVKSAKPLNNNTTTEAKQPEPMAQQDAAQNETSTVTNGMNQAQKAVQNNASPSTKATSNGSTGNLNNSALHQKESEKEALRMVDSDNKPKLSLKLAGGGGARGGMGRSSFAGSGFRGTGGMILSKEEREFMANYDSKQAEREAAAKERIKRLKMEEELREKARQEEEERAKLLADAKARELIKRREEEEKERLRQEKQRQIEEAERRKREEEEARLEAERRKKEEEERKAREAEEARLEAERRKKEEERRAKEAEQARIEAERRKKEEEERKAKEAKEAELARLEAERRKKEEEERREKERKEEEERAKLLADAKARELLKRREEEEERRLREAKAAEERKKEAERKAKEAEERKRLEEEEKKKQEEQKRLEAERKRKAKERKEEGRKAKEAAERDRITESVSTAKSKQDQEYQNMIAAIQAKMKEEKEAKEAKQRKEQQVLDQQELRKIKSLPDWRRKQVKPETLERLGIVIDEKGAIVEIKGEKTSKNKLPGGIEVSAGRNDDKVEIHAQRQEQDGVRISMGMNTLQNVGLSGGSLSDLSGAKLSDSNNVTLANMAFVGDTLAQEADIVGVDEVEMFDEDAELHQTEEVTAFDEHFGVDDGETGASSFADDPKVVKTTVVEEVKAQPAEAAAEEVKAQPAKAVAEEVKAQPAEPAAEEAKAQPAEAAVEEAKAQPAEAVAEEVKAQPAEAAAEEAKAQPAETAAEEAKAQPVETAAVEEVVKRTVEEKTVANNQPEAMEEDEPTTEEISSFVKETTGAVQKPKAKKTEVAKVIEGVEFDKYGIPIIAEKYIGKYVVASAVRKQFRKPLENVIRKKGVYRNIVVLSRKGCSVSNVAIDFARSYHELGLCKTKVVATIKAKILNKTDMNKILPKLQGGCLVIEQAGELSREKALEVFHIMRKPDNDIVLMLVGEVLAVTDMFSKNSELNSLFHGLFLLHDLSDFDLTDIAVAYMKEHDYDADVEGMRALKRRIADLEHNGIDNVLAVVDAAIAKAEKRSQNNLSEVVFLNDYEDSGLNVLKEFDFE